MSEEAVEKFDLFAALRSIDCKDKHWYDNLPEGIKKQVPPVVLMHWLIGSSNDYQTVVVNELVNPYVFSLYKHPGLLCKLMVAASSGKTSRYTYIKNTSKKLKFPKSVSLIQRVYDVSAKEANIMFPLIGSDELIILASQFGWQKDSIKELQKELKDRV